MLNYQVTTVIRKSLENLTNQTIVLATTALHARTLTSVRPEFTIAQPPRNVLIPWEVMNVNVKISLVMLFVIFGRDMVIANIARNMSNLWRGTALKPVKNADILFDRNFSSILSLVNTRPLIYFTVYLIVLNFK